MGSGSVYVPDNRVEAFRHYGLPTTKKQLRTFLGTIGYYRRFKSDTTAGLSKGLPTTLRC